MKNRPKSRGKTTRTTQSKRNTRRTTQSKRNAPNKKRRLFKKKQRGKKKEYTQTKGKAGKEMIWYYFILHNIISLIFFVWFIGGWGLFDRQTTDLITIFSMEHLQFVIIIIGISFISGLLGRFFAYLILYANYKYQKLIPRTYGELDIGVNKIDSAYFISLILSSILFSIGAIFILQEKIFGDNNVISLILSYFIIKISIMLYVNKKYR
ncbi:MAG: hypothetical protein ACFFG0_17940 [Candidatus Thorarchaeota archaeon]